MNDRAEARMKGYKQCQDELQDSLKVAEKNGRNRYQRKRKTETKTKLFLGFWLVWLVWLVSIIDRSLWSEPSLLRCLVQKFSLPEIDYDGHYIGE